MQQPVFNLPQLYTDTRDDVLVIAHRGASAYYPENTMIAFEKALAMQADMIEVDVMMSKDRVPVVFHDAELEDHSDGEGSLKDYKLQELQKLDTGSWFDEQFSDQTISTLEEVLQFAAGTIALNIEIKKEAVRDELHGGIEEEVLKLVEKYKMKQYVLFSSFDYRSVRHFKAMDKSLSVALLYEKKKSDGKLPSELMFEYNADAFNCTFRQLNKKRQADIKKHNIPTFVYTIDQPKRMRKLIDRGVNGIFTNKPDILREVLKEEKNG